MNAKGQIFENDHFQIGGSMKTILMTILLSSLALTSFAQAPDEYHKATETKFEVSKDKSFKESMDQSMSIMHKDMMESKMTGNPDGDFVSMMIPHHQGAINMARIILVHGKDAKVKKMATKIISDQEREIKEMNVWLRNHPTKMQ